MRIRLCPNDMQQEAVSRRKYRRVREILSYMWPRTGLSKLSPCLTEYTLLKGIEASTFSDTRASAPLFFSTTAISGFSRVSFRRRRPCCYFCLTWPNPRFRPRLRVSGSASVKTATIVSCSAEGGGEVCCCGVLMTCGASLTTETSSPSAWTRSCLAATCRLELSHPL